MKINLKQIKRTTGAKPQTAGEALSILKNCMYFLSHHNKNLTKEQDYNIYLASEIINSIELTKKEQGEQ